MRAKLSTWVLAGTAIASVALNYVDSSHGRGPDVSLGTSRASARRVFPALTELDPGAARIDIELRGEPVISIEPDPDGGHRVAVDGEVVGVADPDAVEGVWDSLRIATTLRAAGDPGAIVPRGAIVVTFGDAAMRLDIGGPTPDGSGLYGILGGEAWVVESELGTILEQSVETWVSARASLLSAAELVAVTWSDAAIRRGADGIWRGTVGPQSAMLANVAVDLRLDQVLAARLTPFVERDAVDGDSLRPWLTLEDVRGRTHVLAIGGPCPGAPDRRVVDRGVGRLGCIASELAGSWKLPPDEGGQRLLEPRLAPHDYGRVLAVEQHAPEPRRLRRHGGGWVIEEGETLTEVAEPEVFRWYTALSEVEVEPWAGGEDGWNAADAFTVETDSTQTLRLRCGGIGDSLVCQRDQGPLVRLRPATVASGFATHFDPETFAERSLLAEFDPVDARAIEILPGPGTPGVRQSAHFDLGVWRLDAPSHPDGDLALDELGIEALLAGVSSLRADEWVDVPSRGALRTIVVDRVAQRGDREPVEVELFDRCVVRLPGRSRAARVGPGACEALGDDLLVEDIMRIWIEQAATLELTSGSERLELRRSNERWVERDGREPEGIGARIEGLMSWTATGLRAGRPRGRARAVLRLRASEAPARIIELADDWMRISDAEWYYVGAR